MASDRRDPAGTVAVYASEAGSFLSLFNNLNDLDVPEGTIKVFKAGNRCKALNELVQVALENDSYWVWFIAAEYGFKPNILRNLISRNEAMVAPVALQPWVPYLPQAWSDVVDGGVRPFPLDQIVGPTSLLEIRGASMNGMLVRRADFEALSYPWFTFTGDVNEDVAFCERARNTGNFKIHLDTSSRLSTFSASSITPTHKGARWEIEVGVGEDINVTIPLRHT